MGIRRNAAVVLAALGTLTAGTFVAAATAWAHSPLQVEVSEPKCFNGAALQIVPAALKPAVEEHTRSTATVVMTFRSATGGDQRVPYSVTVDGAQRASGAVSGSGKSISGVTLDKGKSSRVVATSGPVVVFDQVITVRC